MDPLNWLFLGVAFIAALIWYQWTNSPAVKAQATINEATRQQAKPLIPLAAEQAIGDFFELQQTPMLIKPTGKLAESLSANPRSYFDPAIADALWTQQRAMLLRLEGELEMAQQADLSAHFAVAAPANQPADLFVRTLSNAEKSLAAFCAELELADPQRLWFGRAQILLLSNRKLFDHVAWLTGADLGTTITGAYFLATDGVALLPIYATRLTDSRRTILQQVTAALLYCLDQRYARCPRWVEAGLARWLEPKVIAAPQQQLQVIGNAPQLPSPTPATAQPAALDPQTILNPTAWVQAQPEQLEQLMQTSGAVIGWLMTQHRQATLRFLHHPQAAASADAALQETLGIDSAALLEKWTTESQGRAQDHGIAKVV